MSILFVSDLHLDAVRPAATDGFLRFLREQAMQAQALYILGDLFESWVGDDDTAALADAVRAGLRAVAAAAVPVFFQRGNRDFLVGPRFAAETGVRLLPDPALVLLQGEPTLLMHGDLLCSDDIAYQAFRAQVRAPSWQASFLAQPLPERQAFAAQARAASRRHQQGLRQAQQLETITDVNDGSVRTMLQRFGVTRLIHGHTHRPGIHTLRLGARSAQRVVLGDWYAQGSVLRISADGLMLETLPL